jgi:hypothetical protein
MKRKFKQWWSLIPPRSISTKQTITSDLTEHKKTTIYYIGNPSPCLGQAQKKNLLGEDVFLYQY